MDTIKQNELDTQVRKKLQQELKKYQENKQEFTDYLKVMRDLDTWLQNGAQNENC